MSPPNPISRRTLVQRLAVGLSVAPLTLVTLRSALAAGQPLLTPDAPEAKALQYTDDAKTAKTAKPGSHCGSCALFQGAKGAEQGPCQIFPGKDVKATGWCMSWTPQM